MMMVSKQNIKHIVEKTVIDGPVIYPLNCVFYLEATSLILTTLYKKYLTYVKTKHTLVKVFTLRTAT
jgi:hypothetical protein